MARIFHPLLALIACASRQELARQVHFLKVENRILRARLPERIVVRPEERKKLLKAAKGVGKAIRELTSIVSPKTFLRWMTTDSKGSRKSLPKRKPGRPKTPEEIRTLVVKLARENHWGYTRILGELRKLGVNCISRQTVKNILVENSLEPGPQRGEGTWEEFLRIHSETLWQCDFFSKRIVTATGFRQCFVLVFLNIATRKVFVTPCTFKPNPAWMKTQAEAFLEQVKQESMKVTILARDNDGMYVKEFGEVFRDAGIQIKRGRPASPNLRAHIERFVQTIQQECLDHFLVLGERHFDFLIREFVEHYHQERPHQGLGNVPLTTITPPQNEESVNPEKTVCRERLGGLLKHYSRAA